MSRQIKSDIFGDPHTAPVPAPTDLEPLPLNSIDGSEQSAGLYEDLLERLEKTRYQMKEWANSINLRLEKTGQRYQTLEDRFKQAALENHERLANVAARIKDRSSSDMKVEALIERHNQIVQSFELRLSQSQRLIENQSLQLAKQQELIDDARRQIEKLKKL